MTVTSDDPLLGKLSEATEETIESFSKLLLTFLMFLSDDEI